MSGKRSFYAWGHTAQGLISFAESNLVNIDNVFVLNHPSETLKTAAIKKIINHYENTCDIELIESVYGNEYLDGVIIRDKSLAVVSQPVAAGNISVIDFKDIKLDDYEELFAKKSSLTTIAHETFATGLKIHDKLEKIYIDEMDFAKADKVADAFINRVVSSSSNTEQEGFIYHRLFGTNTKDGVVNVVPELIGSVSKAYFIKGRAGTGKSTFMKKIANTCKEKGYKTELYHCSFDSNSIDMVLVGELDFCIFDSTDPHEFFPVRENDEIIDLYEELVTAGTDEKFATDINKINAEYKSYMKKGIKHLQEASLYQNKLEKEFNSTTTTDINEVTAYILNRVK